MFSTLATALLSFSLDSRLTLHLRPSRYAMQGIGVPQRRELLMPCSPVSVAILYPCDLTDAEWTQLAPLLPTSNVALPLLREHSSIYELILIVAHNAERGWTTTNSSATSPDDDP